MTATNNSTDYELVITREFDAPREMVFKMWTDKMHLVNWWGPKGFTLLISNLDLRPDGIFLYKMASPDGFEMWGKFSYSEIISPEKIVFTSSFSDANGGTIRAPFSTTWPLEVLNILTLEESDGKTLLTLKGGPVNATNEELETFRGGISSMQQGFNGTFTQLAEYLEQVRN